jgi:hypothetical protein
MIRASSALKLQQARMSAVFGQTLTVSSSAVGESANNFSTAIPFPLSLDEHSFVGLVSFQIWNTNPNVINGVNSDLRILNAGLSLDIAISLPTGTYQVSDMAEYIANAITTGGGTATDAVFGDSLAQGLTTWTLTAGYYVIMSAGFAALTGWTELTVPPGAPPGPTPMTLYYGQQPANIQNGLTALQILVNAVDPSGSLTSGQMTNQNSGQALPSSVAYVFSFSQPPNTLQATSINPIIFLPVDPGFYRANKITVQIVDQNGNPVSFNQGTPLNAADNATVLTFMFTRNEARKQTQILTNMLDNTDNLVKIATELYKHVTGSEIKLPPPSYSKGGGIRRIKK